MPRQGLKAGVMFSQSMVVSEGLTVPSVSPSFIGFADMPSVFATAFMVGFVEWTCIEAIRPYLLLGEHSVGTRIDVSHVAATPIGMRVTAEVRLTAVEGRRLRFHVTCRDEHELVGEGDHERALIQIEQFAGRVEAKRIICEAAGRSPHNAPDIAGERADARHGVAHAAHAAGPREPRLWLREHASRWLGIAAPV
jgi:fluoroacetyl-CoA thioesterase